MFEWRKEKSLHGWSSIGIQYIAATLKYAGHTVYSKVFEGISTQKVANMIAETNPDLVGFVIFRENSEEMYHLASYIKQANSNIKIIVGGHTATLYAEKILNESSCIDMVSYGEGEQTFIDLCNILDNGGQLSDCKGIFYRHYGSIFKNKHRQLVDNLDELENPDLDIVAELNKQHNSFIFTSISTSRGCLGNCAFCVEHRVSKGENGKEWRGRNLESVINEIVSLKKRFKDKKLVINFVDGSIEDPDPVHKTRLIELLDQIENSDVRFAFSFLTRAESWKQEDVGIIKRMKKLGLFCASIGLESGSEGTLQAFGKRATLEDNLRACKLFKDNGVGVNGFLIMFQPYTKLEDLIATANFLKQCHLTSNIESWSNAVYIYPDTRLFTKIVRDGLIIGTDSTGCIYKYAFEDGRIEKVCCIMQRISNDSNVIILQNLMEIITRALQIYNVWKMWYPEFEEISNIMEQFEKVYYESLDKIGEFQYMQFIQLVRAVESNHSITILNNIAEKWLSIISEEKNQIESIWIQNQMKIGRLGFRLV